MPSKTNKSKKDKIPSKKCIKGKEVNPKSGRCKKITPPKKCVKGKEVNPKSGRCKKITPPKKCAKGKVINPKSGRCKKGPLTLKDIMPKSRSFKSLNPSTIDDLIKTPKRKN